MSHKFIGEIWIDTRKYREKLGLECANGAFSCVAPVCVGRYSLIMSVPLFRDGPLVLRTCFVIEYLEINNKFIVD